jgi:HTH-type transcriptional regulator/antitoxin HigA
MTVAQTINVFRAWHAFQAASPVRLALPRTEAEYQAMVGLMNELLDEIGENEDHDDMDLLDLVSILVETYEKEQVRIPEATPAGVLAYLMKEHGLKQSDLISELGSQSVVSDVLRNNRKITAAQAKMLGERFGVSPAAFI